MKPIPPDRLAAAVEVGARVFAILHLIAIPIILIWWHAEAQSAYDDRIMQAQSNAFGWGRSYVHKPPGGVTFWMQLYIAFSGAIFWATVAAGLTRARAWTEKHVNSADGLRPPT